MGMTVIKNVKFYGFLYFQQRKSKLTDQPQGLIPAVVPKLAS